jgi:hypothetical protein
MTQLHRPRGSLDERISGQIVRQPRRQPRSRLAAHCWERFTPGLEHRQVKVCRGRAQHFRGGLLAEHDQHQRQHGERAE